MNPDVAICYLHPGQVSASFTMSLVRLMIYETGRCGMPPLIAANRCASGNLVAGRNDLVKDILDRSECSWLMFIDSDMGFTADSLERLLKAADPADAPIVGGLCFGLRRESTDQDIQAESFRMFPTVYQWVERENEVGFQVISDYPTDDLIRVGATGAAFTLLHRSALETIRVKYGDNWYSQVTHPKGPTTFSEDMSFCIRAQACGLPIHIDTSVKTSHDKGGVFLTEKTWQIQQGG